MARIFSTRNKDLGSYYMLREGRSEAGEAALKRMVLKLGRNTQHTIENLVDIEATTGKPEITDKIIIFAEGNFPESPNGMMQIIDSLKNLALVTRGRTDGIEELIEEAETQKTADLKFRLVTVFANLEVKEYDSNPRHIDDQLLRRLLFFSEELIKMPERMIAELENAENESRVLPFHTEPEIDVRRRRYAKRPFRKRD